MTPSANRPKLGLALGGGAARGIAHLGVLRAFRENEIPIDCIAGTSAGAIAAACFAFGVPIDEIIKRAKKLTWYSLANFPDSMLGLASNRSVERLMEEVIGKKEIEKAEIPLAIATTDIESGSSVILRKGHAASAVRASACIPGLFAPVEIGGRKLLDGALSENVPLSPLKDMGADIVVGVNLVHWHSERKVQNALDVVSNSLDIMARHQEEEPLRRDAIIIEPDLAKYSPSDFKQVDALVAEGYHAAMKKIPEIKQLLSRRKKRKAPKGFFGRIAEWLAR